MASQTKRMGDRMKEADLKRTISDYLEYGTNQGKWYADRLNSGSVIVKKGSRQYKVQLCHEGTADFMVVRNSWTNAYPTHINVEHCRLIFLELKGEKGKQRPEQGTFQKLVEAQGAEYYIIRSLNDLECALGG